MFEESIAALRRFNELGYGVEGSGLVLNLVTNPVGAFLPAGAGGARSATGSASCQRRYGISFNRLYTITNMPISRYLEFLVASGNLQAYMEKLVGAFNPAAVEGLMCRSTLSVGWDGRLYDCDFNQMIDLGVDSRRAADDLRRHRARSDRPPHRHRPPLLRLHRRRGLELRRHDSRLSRRGGRRPVGRVSLARVLPAGHYPALCATHRPKVE